MARILLVEDDPDTLLVLRSYLESANHEVILARTGEQAMAAARSSSPDLIVSDVMMPGLSGLDLLRALREQPGTVMIPVILVTAAREQTVYREGMRLGADDYIVKPVRRNDLLESVATRLKRVKELREAFDRASTAARNAAPPPPAAASAIHVEGYSISRKLGEGGMSRVYLAEHLSSRTERVLKVVPITDSDDGESVQRFIHEFALVSSIDHPNVARIFDQGFTDDHAYIAMEYFPGGDLRAMIGQGMSPDLVTAVLIQAASGLGAIHQQGVVHRDMKPDNIMVRADGTLAIADFGIAKKPNAELSRTQHGEVFGTPYYLSPEQATSGTVDARSDLYSLGVMCYEMLTGAKPYRAPDIEGLLYMHINAPVPSLPEPLSRFQPILDRTMAKDPRSRFTSAEDLVTACTQLIAP